MKEIYVEIFESRSAFEDLLMEALNKTDEVERLMAETSDIGFQESREGENSIPVNSLTQEDKSPDKKHQ